MGTDISQATIVGIIFGRPCRENVNSATWHFSSYDMPPTPSAESLAVRKVGGPPLSAAEAWQASSDSPSRGGGQVLRHPQCCSVTFSDIPCARRFLSSLSVGPECSLGWQHPMTPLQAVLSPSLNLLSGMLAGSHALHVSPDDGVDVITHADHGHEGLPKRKRESDREESQVKEHRVSSFELPSGPSEIEGGRSCLTR